MMRSGPRHGIWSRLPRRSADRVRRGVLVPLIAGWLLGLLTAFVWPAVSTERQTVVIMGPSDLRSVRSDTQYGWIVTRSDAVGGTDAVTLERPRYLAVAEQLQSWWSDLMVRTGAAPPPTPTPVPKPTEAPKPAAAASPPKPTASPSPVASPLVP